MTKVVLNNYLGGMSELNVACCNWLMQHAEESGDSTFCELVKTSPQPWYGHFPVISQYFEDKRSHPLLVKCIETVSECWPYHIEEYDENLFHCTIDIKESYDPEYDTMVMEGESLKLTPLIREAEVSELMKHQDFNSLIAYLKARNINMVVE